MRTRSAAAYSDVCKTVDFERFELPNLLFYPYERQALLHLQCLEPVVVFSGSRLLIAEPPEEKKMIEDTYKRLMSRSWRGLEREVDVRVIYDLQKVLGNELVGKLRMKVTEFDIKLFKLPTYFCAPT